MKGERRAFSKAEVSGLASGSAMGLAADTARRRVRAERSGSCMVDECCLGSGRRLFVDGGFALVSHKARPGSLWSCASGLKNSL